MGCVWDVWVGVVCVVCVEYVLCESCMGVVCFCLCGCLGCVSVLLGLVSLCEIVCVRDLKDVFVACCWVVWGCVRLCIFECV